MTYTAMPAANWKDYTSYILAWVLFAVPIMATVIQSLPWDFTTVKTLSESAEDWLTAAAATFVVLYLIHRRRTVASTDGESDDPHIFEFFAIICAYIAAVMLPDRQTSSYWAILLLSTASVGLSTTRAYTWTMFKESIGDRSAKLVAFVFGGGSAFAIVGLVIASKMLLFGLPYGQWSAMVGLIGLFFVTVSLLSVFLRVTIWRRHRPSDSDNDKAR